MLDDLRFVQGSVARKDFNPALVHFHIQGGKVQGYNGMLSLCSPIALDLDVTPNAVQLIKALAGCKETVALSVTPNGRLAIKSGKYKAFVECYPGGFPEIVPSGKRVELPATFLNALAALEPCIAEDASRQWARGILFRGQSAFVTNNVVLLEYFLGAEFPSEINLPAAAVRELLRLKENPEAMLVEDGAVTFQFRGGRWMRTQLYTTQWPDVSRILDGEFSPKRPLLTVDHLDDLEPFTDDAGRVFLSENLASTSTEEATGASVEIEGLGGKGIFNLGMLRLALERLEVIDFGGYPGPCHFLGPNMRGVIIGMRS